MDGAVLWQPEALPEASRLGTRFLVFPQPPFIPGYERPEIVRVFTPPDQMEPGPADRRMYVVDPIGAKTPYEFPYLPPFAGPFRPPAEAGPDGHFDHFRPGSREFQAAHVFACARRVVDICQGYFGGEIPWFFAPTYERLEIVPRLSWGNAQSGFGFLEMGEDDSRPEIQPFALNFDAVAHETGHLMLFGVMGLPQAAPPTQFFAYHEAVADFVALIGFLHFDTGLDLLLRRTRGNLLVMNELDRFAELSDEKQVRMFNHSLKLGDVGGEVHDLSKPFAGALFDTLIEIYQVLLYERGLSDLDPRAFSNLRSELSPDEIERELTLPLDDYQTRHFAVKSVLIEARDLVGEMLIRSWSALDPDALSYREAAEAIIRAAENGRARRFSESINEVFAWRGIL